MKHLILICTLFLACFNANAAVSSPPPDSCMFPCEIIPYTDQMDANCLECLVNKPKYLNKIEKLEIHKIESIQYIDDQKMEIDKLRDENMQLIHENGELKKSKKNLKTVIFATLGIIAVETTILLVK